MRWLGALSFRRGLVGMSRDLGQDVPDLEKLYARKLWELIFRSLRKRRFSERTADFHWKPQKTTRWPLSP